MDTPFMSFKNSATSETHRLLFNLTDKTDLKRIHMLVYQIYIEKYKEVIQK